MPMDHGWLGQIIGDLNIKAILLENIQSLLALCVGDPKNRRGPAAHIKRAHPNS